MAEARRDQWGCYSVVPPDGSEPRGYTRVTTVAKTLDDGGGLIPWKACATVVGMLRRPGLHASWQALTAEHPDPWYASPQSKERAKKLVEECATAGGSSDRAEVGTALHALIEQQLRHPGANPLLQPGMQSDIDAFHATIGASGITFNPDLIEAIVVLDGPQVAGTADQLQAYVPGIGHVVSDLKTGTELKYSWQAIAIQLAAYAHADNVYQQGDAPDGSRDERLPMPTLSQEVGLVIHLPAGEARCDLYLVDLVAGWEAFEMSMMTRKWRARRDIARQHTFAPVPALATTAPSSGSDSPTASVPSSQGPAQPPPDFDLPVPVPPTVAPGKGGAPVDSSADAAPPEFATPPVSDDGAQRAWVQAKVPPEEGAGADFTAAEIAYAALLPDARAWITRLARDAMTAHVSFHAKDVKSVRRFEILRGLLLLAASNDACDDEVLRALLEHVIGEPAHFAAVTPGALVGSLSATEAAAFAQRCSDFADGRYVAHIVGDGRFSLRLAA
jgi:hypothetical protein